jgi:hypothetical protein
LFTTIALTVGLLGTSGWAQGPAGDTVRIQAVKRVRLGSEVRVATNEGTHRGKVLRITATDLVLDEGAAPRTVSFAALDSLWVARRSTGKGAWVGALVGLGVGAAIGTAAGEGWSDTPQIAGTLLGGGAGALGGALLGAVSGAVSRTWVREYPK